MSGALSSIRLPTSTFSSDEFFPDSSRGIRSLFGFSIGCPKRGKPGLGIQFTFQWFAKSGILDLRKKQSLVLAGGTVFRNAENSCELFVSERGKHPVSLTLEMSIFHRESLANRDTNELEAFLYS